MWANGVQEVDLHNKTAEQARRTLDAALRNADSGTYRLRVIHGYHGGQVLRKLVWKEYAGHPKVKRLVRVDMGATDLVLRELY